MDWGQDTFSVGGAAPCLSPHRQGPHVDSQEGAGVGVGIKPWLLVYNSAWYK